MKLLSYSGPGIQLSTVVVDYINTVTFPVNSSAGTTITSFRIRKALETLETYNLSLTGSVSSGPPTQIEIEDDSMLLLLIPQVVVKISLVNNKLQFRSEFNNNYCNVCKHRCYKSVQIWLVKNILERSVPLDAL